MHSIKHLSLFLSLALLLFVGATTVADANCTTATFINNGPSPVTIKMAVDCSPNAVVFTLNAGQTLTIPGGGCCILEARIAGPGWNIVLRPGQSGALPAPFIGASVSSCSIVVI